MRMLLIGLCLAATSLSAAEPVAVEVLPREVILSHARSRQQLLVSADLGNGQRGDLTTQAKYQSVDPKIALVDDRGVVTPRGTGSTQITVRVGKHEQLATVTVGDITTPAPIDFTNETLAAFSRAGCNSGACHGSPQGKGGFRLSLRGYDAALDTLTVTREAGGRRINPFAPSTSLILQKGSGRLPHQGGIRFRSDEAAYLTLQQWIAEGGATPPADRKLVRLEVLPGSQRLHSDHPRQQLVALAHFDDGTVNDVSPLAIFSTNVDPAVEVSNDGLVTFHSTGEATVLVKYLEQVKGVRLTYVKHDPQFVFRAPPLVNDVDRHIFAKQQTLQLQPAELCDDATFLRRVTLDLTGALPTVDEARAFLASTAADKRARWIDTLLERETYASFWALKWADVMRGSRETISERGVHSFHRYLVQHFAADRSFAELARAVITGSGNTLHRPEANFYRIAQTTEDAAESFAQLFLGLRVQCARCHNHPFEALTQNDYYGLAAFFARVKNKGKQFMLDDTIIYLARNGEVQHPQTKKTVEPIAFGVPAGTLTADDDRREKLADWLLSADNRWFATSTVNRMWYHLLGTGIVEPVDDFRDSNPPSHPELLQALADEFVRSGYRFKPVIRMILNSRAYQLASQGMPKQSPHAARPDRYFVQAKIRMLSAEQILDGICTATGLPERFAGYPLGTRATEIAEGAVPHHFLTAFSKPIRDVQCDCAREDEPSLNQVIHLLNNAGVIEKIRSPESLLGRWLNEKLPTDAIIERLYLAVLTRLPTAAEKQLALKHVQSLNDDSAGFQDLLHALLNANEFLLRH